MKKNIMLFLLLLAFMLPATAHDFEVDGIYYSINGNEVSVTYRGTSSSQYSNEYSGNVTIPATLTYNGTTYSVTAIGNSAFYGCTALTSVIIPNTVTTIGSYAFNGCSSLADIDIPNSVNYIGEFAFESTAWLDNQPDGLVYAGLVAYKYKGTMSSGTIILRDGTLGIAGGAFCDYSSLTSIYIPNSVIAIGDGAFMFCSRLSSIDIPNSVTSIGCLAFSYCSSLTSITIPNSVTTIGSNAFLGSKWYDSQSDGLVYAGLVAYEYKGTMPSGTSITLKAGTNGIADGAFRNCSGLTSITIPNSVTAIGGRAFSYCSGLTGIIIPNSVTTIGSYAFECCSGLTSVTIGNSVTIIGFNAFYDCSGLTSIVVSSGNNHYDSRNNCNAIIETATNTLIVGCKNSTIPNSVTSIGNYAFYGCSILTSINIPNSVTSIGSGAFYSCTGLTSISIPNSVTSIGFDAFRFCTSLNRVKISDIEAWCNIEFVDVCANPLSYAGHLYLNGLEIIELNIPNSVTSIGKYAFENCRDLTSVTIPNSVTSIGDSAFIACRGLTEIYCLALTPPTAYSGTFYSCYGATLYVPKAALNAYKTANYWKNFTNIVGIGSVLPNSIFVVDGIYYRVNGANVVSVIANEEVDAYYTGDVVIPDAVSYEEDTFTVTGIENSAFENCYELTSVVIPNSVESIGEQAFQGCTGLTSVIIGSAVTAIGVKAFNYCNALATVKCLGTVPPVMASSDCFSTAAYNRAALIVPRNYEATYGAADYWYKFAHIDGWGSAGRGDVNGDGVMSIRDVVTLIDVLLGNEIDSFYFESADLNSNGRIDIGDVASIIDGLLNGF